MTGAPFREREIHDLADLLGVGFRERAAEDGEVLGEDVDQPAVDPARIRSRRRRPEIPAAPARNRWRGG